MQRAMPTKTPKTAPTIAALFGPGMSELLETRGALDIEVGGFVNAGGESSPVGIVGRVVVGVDWLLWINRSITSSSKGMDMAHVEVVLGSPRKVSSLVRFSTRKQDRKAHLRVEVTVREELTVLVLEITV
jgi:hypothetical protein